MHLQAIRNVLFPLLTPPRVARVPLMKAMGRGLAETIYAPTNLPPFTNSQMDGYAVRSRDVAVGQGELRVASPVPAGAVPAPLAGGTAAPIMTGALLPDGADAVIPVERAVPDHFPPPGLDTTVRLPEVAAGTFVRGAGSDVAAGECALPAGTVLGPRQLGLLAALGITEVVVNQKLTVLLATTGDEVLEPGDKLAPGKIYDANNTLLESSMLQAGLNVVRAGIVKDEPGALSKLLRSRTAHVDLIVTSGGVSAGAYEPVRQTMMDHDVEFSHVAIQPGGPQGVGTFEGIPILAFPGNPVSCYVSFEMFLRPLLSELFAAPTPRLSFRAPLSHPLTSPPNKHQIRRGVLLANGTVRLEGGEGSHLLGALARSNVLVHIPEGVSELAEGSEVEVWAV
ncbi:gephyrin-like molybdotransferase Glp [Pseudarthrobacter oxydans]|uniref:molybdopterin molybdotransferase MoeA n=1 Tax=Pseudarthrobacter oxydans TaxID=1671 RepID=UPI003450ECED